MRLTDDELAMYKRTVEKTEEVLEFCKDLSVSVEGWLRTLKKDEVLNASSAMGQRRMAIGLLAIVEAWEASPAAHIAAEETWT
jgi:hypothetical protein